MQVRRLARPSRELINMSKLSLKSLLAVAGGLAIALPGITVSAAAQCKPMAACGAKGCAAKGCAAKGCAAKGCAAKGCAAKGCGASKHKSKHAKRKVHARKH